MTSHRNFASVVATVICVAALIVGHTSASVAQIPSAIYNFNEGAGSTAADSSENGHVGTLIGDASWSSNAVSGGSALQLSGHGYVEVPTSVIDTSKSYTVSAWVNLNNTTGYQTIVSIDGNSVSGFFLQLRASGTFGFVHITKDGTNASTNVAASLVPVQPHQWYNLIGVHDQSTKTDSLYVDGVLQDTESFDSSWPAEGNLEIGRGKYDGRVTDFVNGEIDDVSITQGVHVDQNLLSSLQAKNQSVPAQLTIDAGKSGASISPTLYGLMIEDISHSIDGGLYAELVRNRSLLDDNSTPSSWSAVAGTGTVTISVDTTQPVPSTSLTNSLKVVVSKSGNGVGVANSGYWGIPVSPQELYSGSFYAKTDGSYTGPLTLAIQNNDGSHIYASTKVRGISNSWNKFYFTLKGDSSSPSESNRLVLLTSGSGVIWLTEVSLFPPTYNSRPNGTRIDLMDKLAAMHPTFLRLPGGNFLEGNNIPDRFDWKKTVGSIELRPGHNDPWGYRSTDGFGLLEYLEWCDDLHMEPILAVYAGYSLSGQHVVAGPALEPYVQDALDEIQYLIGDKSTTWGAIRAEYGHPAPFALHYVEIGNEDFFDVSGSYDGRFAQFYDAIKAAYPNLQLIATRGDVKSRTPDMVDEHFYEGAREFEADWHHYDSYSRSGPKIFVGEYASQNGNPTPNLKAALGDASFMAGFERNADLIRIASYAPLLVNINPGASQWVTNLIGFDSLNSYVSPSYYTQQLFSVYHGDTVVPAELTGGVGTAYSVNKVAATGTIYLKVVNPLGSASQVNITINGANSVAPTGTAIVLKSGSDIDTNTIEQPNNVIPVKSTVTGIGKSFEYTFPPYSLTVLVLGTT